MLDQKIKDIFKGIFADLIKSFSEAIATGKGLVGVSLPIRIIEFKSYLERIVSSFSFSPSYLIPNVDY